MLVEGIETVHQQYEVKHQSNATKKMHKKITGSEMACGCIKSVNTIVGQHPFLNIFKCRK